MLSYQSYPFSVKGSVKSDGREYELSVSFTDKDRATITFDSPETLSGYIFNVTPDGITLTYGDLTVPYHSSGIPGGDGMNVFSKYPIYNAERTPWDMTYGVIKEGADELTPKGILYSVIDLGDGLYVDFYVIHADAFDGEGSRAARNDNFRQLAELIASKGSTRPVIVTGDFNTSSHLDQGAEFTRIMITEGGFKDAWTELYNGGNYTDYKAVFKH